MKMLVVRACGCRVGDIVFRMSVAGRRRGGVRGRIRAVQRDRAPVSTSLHRRPARLPGVLLHQDQRRQKYDSPQQVN